MNQQACMQGPTPALRVAFDCFPPAEHPPLRKLHKPLPLQTTPTANLEWASAFLDHTAHLIKAREQKYEELAKDYISARNTIDRNKTEVEKLKKDNTSLKHHVEHLYADVARQETAYKRLEKAFDQFRTRAKTEREDRTHELNSTRKQLNAALSDVKTLKAKLKEADEEAHAKWLLERLSDAVDHEALHKVQDSLDSKNKAYDLLHDQLDGKIRQLIETQQELQAAKDGQAMSQKEIARLNGQIKQLNIDIADRDRTIGRYESDLTLLRDGNAALKSEKGQLSVELANKRTELQKAEQDLAAAQKEAAELNDRLSEQATTIEELSGQLRDQKDQNSKQQAESETTIKKLMDQIDVFLKHDAEDEQKLAENAKKINDLSQKLAASMADDESDKASIEQLKAEKENLKMKIADQADHDATDDVNLAKLKKALADKDKSLKEAEEQKKASDAASKELQEQLKGLAQKNEELASDDSKDKETIKILEDAKKYAEKAIQHMKAQTEAARKEAGEAKKKAADAEAERKSAEAAAAKAATELDEAKKQLLPNDVTLANPIALVGSLRGAPRDVDDETFYINCSFPVTLFNASSSKIYISSNGLFTLDHASVQFNYQKLPYRPWTPWSQLPDCVLAPFWADLKIYKNTPQGVYYEVTGVAPNRKLEVEWYVSRYNSPKQYYHFSLAVEEAKPNLATFKYFEAMDKGGKCTIGVQGPKTSSMFSYNEEKALPGTQVTFDTSKNTFTRSTFKIPAAAVKETLKENTVKDVKSANAVTATVHEVVDV